MKKIGLTGGIGSGKSTVAYLLGEAGYQIIDADQIAREIVEPGQPALQALASEFGADILNDQGVLRRDVLATRAFVDEHRTAKLNELTHPHIIAATKRQFQELEKQGWNAAIWDMPLLIELGLHTGMDATIVVDTDLEIRVQRLVNSRGLEEADVRARMQRQVSDLERRQAATWIVSNNGTEEELKAQVTSLIATLQESGLQAR